MQIRIDGHTTRPFELAGMQLEATPRLEPGVHRSREGCGPTDDPLRPEPSSRGLDVAKRAENPPEFAPGDGRAAAECKGITSIIVPLYNHEHTVEQALDSLLASDCRQIELIISDDASTDRSLEVSKAWLQRHGDKFHRTRLIENEKNLGITGNMNRLLAASTGEFVSGMASDDMVAPGAVDRQREYLLNHPSVDFLFANFTVVDSHGRMLKERVLSRLHAALLWFRPFILLNVMFNWNVVWSGVISRRRKFLEFGGYIEKHSIDDRWLALKIMNTRRYAFVDDVFRLYRFRGWEAHPAISSNTARKDFHDAERRLHPEATGLLYLLLWVRRLPFKTNHGKWPCRF